MSANQQKTVILGVSGCIAAYKSCEVLRGLQKAGVRVKVVMTEHATHFVDPVTFRALTHETVAVGLFDDPTDPIHHISLAEEADILLLAPCTANVMAKAAHGICDDLLTTTILACTSPIMVAPAMNVHMYENPATQENMQTLRKRGFKFIEAGEGYLACGDVGKGRLAEPDVIVSAVLQELAQLEKGEGAAQSSAEDPNAQDPSVQDSAALHTIPLNDLADKHIMVTAGPTVEPIDPVRYLTNRSSGKFGYAIAKAALQRGAEVTLISGPVALAAPEGAHMVYVETAQDMLEASENAFADCDVALFSAAVADVRPAKPADKKLKKGINDDQLAAIELTENPDILSACGHAKTHQVVVGFAAETNQVVEYAQRKLTKKNADMIVANEVGAKKTFGEDQDEIWLVTADGAEHVDRAPKADLAHVILTKALQLQK